MTRPNTKSIISFVIFVGLFVLAGWLVVQGEEKFQEVRESVSNNQFHWDAIDEEITIQYTQADTLTIGSLVEIDLSTGNIELHGDVNESSMATWMAFQSYFQEHLLALTEAELRARVR